MVNRPNTRTLLIGFVAVAILFVPVPIVTQLIGIPLLLYASYRHWGREARPESSESDTEPSVE